MCDIYIMWCNNNNSSSSNNNNSNNSNIYIYKTIIVCINIYTFLNLSFSLFATLLQVHYIYIYIILEYDCLFFFLSFEIEWIDYLKFQFSLYVIVVNWVEKIENREKNRKNNRIEIYDNTVDVKMKAELVTTYFRVI